MRVFLDKTRRAKVVRTTNFVNSEYNINKQKQKTMTMKFYEKVPVTITADRVTEERELSRNEKFRIEVYCSAELSEDETQLTSFGEIEKKVKEWFDGKNIADVIKDEPTFEKTALYIIRHIPQCYKVKIEDMKGRNVIHTLK